MYRLSKTPAIKEGIKESIQAQRGNTIIIKAKCSSDYFHINNESIKHIAHIST